MRGGKVRRREEEKKGKRRGGGGVENSGLWVEGLFVVVGKVVPSLADCYSILFLFPSYISYLIHSCLESLPYPPSLPLHFDH